MLPDNRTILMQHRLDSAKEKLESAKILLDNGNLKDSIGRSYYAMFTSVRALLARDGVDFSKHAGVIAYILSTSVRHFRSEIMQIMRIFILFLKRMQMNNMSVRRSFIR